MRYKICISIGFALFAVGVMIIRACNRKYAKRFLGPKITCSSTMLLWAFRYCLGKRTYAVKDCVENIIYCWDQLYSIDQRLIQEEIKGYVALNTPGHDIDIKEWKRVLELPLKKEKK